MIHEGNFTGKVSCSHVLSRTTSGSPETGTSFRMAMTFRTESSRPVSKRKKMMPNSAMRWLTSSAGLLVFQHPTFGWLASKYVILFQGYSNAKAPRAESHPDRRGPRPCRSAESPRWALEEEKKKTAFPVASHVVFRLKNSCCRSCFWMFQRILEYVLKDVLKDDLLDPDTCHFWAVLG